MSRYISICRPPMGALWLCQTKGLFVCDTVGQSLHVTVSMTPYGLHNDIVTRYHCGSSTPRHSVTNHVCEVNIRFIIGSYVTHCHRTTYESCFKSALSTLFSIDLTFCSNFFWVASLIWANKGSCLTVVSVRSTHS